MELHNLKPAAGSTKKVKRVGRGQGAGTGGTSTRGHKGAKSRSGYKSKKGFEGGQMPLQMRLPKIGFKSPNRVAHTAINLEVLEMVAEKHNITDITVDKLYELGYTKKGESVKVLATGEVTKALNLTVNAVSKTAQAAIEAKGGSVTLL